MKRLVDIAILCVAAAITITGACHLARHHDGRAALVEKARK